MPGTREVPGGCLLDKQMVHWGTSEQNGVWGVKERGVAMLGEDGKVG